MASTGRRRVTSFLILIAESFLVFQTVIPVLQGMPGGLELFFVLFVLVALVGFVVVVGLSYWVYRDATRRNMDNALLWALVAFFVGPLGIIIYLLVRD